MPRKRLIRTLMQRHYLTFEQNTLEFLDYGAHIVSWRCSGQERLFVSRKAEFCEGKAIRGGIPLIFPQFSTRGPLPRHGFARTQTWSLIEKTESQAHLQLRDNSITRALWSCAFVVDFFISLTAHQLSLQLQVQNVGDDVMDFSSALHTYLLVPDIGTSTISGLAMCNYEDALNKKRRLDEHDSLAFDREIDRIYQCNQVQLHSGAATMRLSSDGFDDTVIWNPHRKTAAGIADLDEGEWQRFVCIEAANVLTKIVLPPGAEWSATHTISVA